jgi:chromosome partitioning protein
MRIIALVQGKGGVGKSATAINLACQAIAHGDSAVLVDADAEQGSSTKWGNRRPDKTAPHVAQADARDLKTVLAKYRTAGVKWAFLDLPGRIATVSSAGLVASDLALIPVRPLDMDIEASVPTIEAAQRAGKSYAYLISMAPPQGHRGKQAAATLEMLGQRVAPEIIMQRIAVPDAIARGFGINEAAPGSESAAEFKRLFQWVRKEVKK